MQDCTPWKEPILEQFMKNYSLWEGLMLKKFMESCLLWEGHRAGAREGLLYPVSYTHLTLPTSDLV